MLRLGSHDVPLLAEANLLVSQPRAMSARLLISLQNG
jgi:hypothetical protein